MRNTTKLQHRLSQERFSQIVSSIKENSALALEFDLYRERGLALGLILYLSQECQHVSVEKVSMVIAII